MVQTNDDLQEKVEKFLKIVTNDKKLSNLYSFKVNLDSNIDSKILAKLVTEPLLIEFDEETGKLFYITNDGDKAYCPDIQEGVSTSRDWISDSLPPIPFDINQKGNLRKACESENIYKCALIAGILKGEFKNEFLLNCENYDYNNLQPRNDASSTFSDLLFRWQELQNLTIRIIVSGANYKISSEKNLEVGFLIGSLNKEETLNVSSIRDRVKTIIREYMLNELSPNNITSMTKIERLIKIQEKDDKVLSEINKSKRFSELYKICSLNSDYLSPGIKNSLSNSAKNFAIKEVSGLYKDDIAGLKKFISTCRRRAYKEAVIAMKEKELEVWRKVGNDLYKLPTKQ